VSEWRLLVGDVRETLAGLPDQAVQCCVTSPPYWGLRDYGHAGQIGLEATPDAYVAELVAVFREVRRVLKDDGTLWLNLGDSYQNAKGQAGGVDPKQPARRHGLRPQDTGIAGLKPKDLVGVPWMVAFALRADGWYLRSDIIWSKPNTMPESVTDRPTKAHEYVFLLAKSARYYYDADAIAESVSVAMLEQMTQGYDGLGLKDYEGAGVQNPSSVKARIIANARERITSKAKDTPRNDGERWQCSGPSGPGGGPGVAPRGLGRNARTVWVITTQPYPDAHFATFPEAIPERCILAGSRVGDIVLDPFTGSGTTGAVASRLGRSFIGCELNEEYAQLARARIGDAAPLFASEATA
jgi:DNA modification methylase